MEQVFYMGQFSAIGIILIGMIILGRVLPKVIRETRVKNGLIELREAMLISAGSIFILGTVALLILVLRYIVPVDVYRILGLILLNVFALMFLIYSLSKDRIYNISFTPDQIEMHRVKAESEARDKARDVRRNTARIKLNSDRRKATRRKNG